MPGGHFGGGDTGPPARVSGSTTARSGFPDLGTGPALTMFTADGVIGSCTITPDGPRVVAGDALGRVHVLEIRL